MSPLHINNVKNCWSKINSAHGLNFLVETFYDRIFSYPEIKILFSNDMASQKHKLTEMLNAVINGIEYIEQLESELIKLGKLHKDKHVTIDQYSIIVEAIVFSAVEASDNTITKEEENDWRDAFNYIAEVMKKAY